MNLKNESLNLNVLLVPIGLTFLIWLVFAIEIRYNFNFNTFGVYPRRVKGILGILLSPFIHSNISHLYSNTFPLLILSSALFYFYNRIAVKVLVLGLFLSGISTWLIGRPSYHIGASGIIYMLFSFIFFKGIITKHYRLIALSLLVVFIYGSMIWYTMPIEKGISWEGHLSGFVVGGMLSLFFKSSMPKPKKYDWENLNYNESNDPFLNQFDENGYFFEIEEEEDLIIDEVGEEHFTTNNSDVVYHFKPKE